ncbi:MAG: hypothetical protein QGF65_02225 [Candidatus Pelagibacter bacterium]|jgi:hypothetical protein|nr:hypothetical protein [Candidatus Pelagibacter bacterium]|tara:strand:- start:383 stop:556 length:174 start_codon:yes stop_codon:yes gene_type:complete
MKKMIFIFFLLFSCTKTNTNQVMNKDIDFDINLSFDEYKSLIIEFGKNSKFPNINKK